MYSRILVAIDGSQVAARALEHGLALARHLGSAVTIVHVAEVAPRAGEDHAAVRTRTQSRVALMAEALHTATTELLDKALEAANAAGVEAAAAWIENRYPARAIVETASAVNADLIVMGTNGRRGFSRLMVGSQTTNVLQHSTVPVLVIRGEPTP